jgi:putative transposase
MASGYDIRRPLQARSSAPHAHLVFITKYRQGVLDDEMLRLCELAMRRACRDFETDLRESTSPTGEADHVHLLVDYPR